MLAQRLRHQITIEQQAVSLNSYRENAGTWSTLRTVFAGVEPVSGKEYAAASATVGETLVRIVCRYIDVSDVTNRMRISFGGEYYDIAEIVNEGTKDRMVSFMCRKGANEGGQ